MKKAIIIWMAGSMLLTVAAAQGDCGDFSASITQATALYKQQQYEPGIRLMEKAVAAYGEEGFLADSCRYKAYRLLGVMYQRKGRDEWALKAYKKSIESAGKSLGETHYRIAFLLGAISGIYERMADFESARNYLEKEVNLLTQNPPPEIKDLSIAQYNLARMYYNLGMYEESESYFLKALPIWMESFGENDPRLKWIYNSLGGIYWEREMQEEALFYYQKALQIDLANNEDVTPVSWTKGEEALSSGSYEQALTYYQQELESRNRTFGRQHPLTAGCYNYIANTLRHQQKYEQALDNYQQAITRYLPDFQDENIYALPQSFIGCSSEQWLLDALKGKAELFFLRFQKKAEKKDLEAAFRHCEFASQVIDALRLRMQGEQSHSFWTRKVRPIYQLGMAVTYELYALSQDAAYLQAAFHFSEKSKAFLLLQALREDEARRYAGVPDSVLRQEKALIKELADNERFLMLEQKNCEASDTIKIQLLQAQIFSLKEKLYDWTGQLARRYPAYHQLKYETQKPDLKAWQAAFSHPQTAVLNFMETDSAMFVLVMTKEKAHLLKAIWGDGARAMLQHWRSSLYDIEKAQTDPQGSFAAITEEGYALYRKLIQPAHDWLQSQGETHRLIIIPDGQLSYVPFEALLQEEVGTRQRAYADLPFLLKKYSISYAYTALGMMAKQAAPPGRSYLGFAPDYPANEGESLAFNREEVEAASSIWPGKTFLNEAATQAHFNEKASRAGILHLAMHAVLNDSSPQYSYLKFSDEVLYTYELYSLSLSAQLAVLSACNTGSGKLIEGEGVISLARAFRYAGCPAVAMSLWPVDDQATARLTTAFFHGLAEGRAKDIALQQAKLAYLAEAEPAFAHPFYWAGINLIGERSALEKGGTPWWVWGIILVSASALALIIRRMRTNR